MFSDEIGDFAGTVQVISSADVKSESDRLRDEVERLKQDIPEVYRTAYFHVAERCVRIADECAAADGMAQRVSAAICDEFGLGGRNGR